MWSDHCVLNQPRDGSHLTSILWSVAIGISGFLNPRECPPVAEARWKCTGLFVQSPGVQASEPSNHGVVFDVFCHGCGMQGWAASSPL